MADFGIHTAGELLAHRFDHFVLAHSAWEHAEVVGTCHCTGRSFCPACGSRVFHLSEAIAEVIIGALDV
jgi:hypothetical protein